MEANLLNRIIGGQCDAFDSVRIRSHSRGRFGLCSAHARPLQKCTTKNNATCNAAARVSCATSLCHSSASLPSFSDTRSSPPVYCHSSVALSVTVGADYRLCTLSYPAVPVRCCRQSGNQRCACAATVARYIYTIRFTCALHCTALPTGQATEIAIRVAVALLRCLWYSGYSHVLDEKHKPNRNTTVRRVGWCMCVYACMYVVCCIRYVVCCLRYVECCIRYVYAA